MLSFGDYNHHWSYYLAIENQLADTARFVEFSDQNKETYSIEFARILLAAASEVDVIAKQLCKILDNNSDAKSIFQYQSFINVHLPNITQEVIRINRYNIILQPWENFALPNLPPTWWTAYNKVKHHRHTNFEDANLKNAMHAVGALHILVVYYYKTAFEASYGKAVSFGVVMNALQPNAALFYMNDRYYGRMRSTHSEL
jgi:hypothetical protein